MAKLQNPIRVLTVAGARPNFMKVAPLLRVFEERDAFASYLVHTGQHYDEAMSGGFFAELGIRDPDVNLGVGSGTHASMTAQVLASIEPILTEQKPDALAVVGDVNSTLAATLAAVKLGIPVAHIEAGLRSFDRTMPEEINRILTDAISQWLFVTEPAGVENLQREGVDPGRIHLVGNLMIDTLLAHVGKARERKVAQSLDLSPGEYAVLTLHRPSNVDDPAHLGRLFDVLEEVHAEIPIAFPMHPRTAAMLSGRLGRSPRLLAMAPLGYLDFLGLMADARFVLTDSGGIQEETTVLGVPCLTLRANTERPVTCSQGTNRLVGTDPDRIRDAIRELLDGSTQAGRIPDLWDGQAAGRIADILERELAK
jgi:UDP-N-acetylglucosamine 2-epimerase (non-hydrolysing)